MATLKRIAVAMLVSVLALGVPIGVGVVAAMSAASQVYPRADAPLPAGLAAPSYDPGKPTVAIVTGRAGANIADTLAPYEVFASTSAFNVYIVAPERNPVTLTGGLQLVPDLDFAALARTVPGGPDAIVIPALPGDTQDVQKWLKMQRAQHHPIVTSVCVGAEVLASAGLLDRRHATSHWLGLIGLRRDYPQVNWQVGQRYVDDGDIITGAGVLSGIDVALRLIERFADQPTATRAAAAVSWPFYSPFTPARFDQSRPSPADLPAVLSAAYRWDRPRLGVLLTDGVGEIELAAAFRPYTELSYLAELTAVSTTGAAVRSRHGLTFLAAGPVSTAPGQIIVPGAAAAERRAGALGPAVEVTYLHDRPGFAFDGTLRDIATRYDGATARWVAKSQQYRWTGAASQGASWPWALAFRPLLMAAGIIVGGILICRFVGRKPPAK